MRVAIITESFPPDVNGVAHTVLRVAEELTRRGHHPLVIAPQPPRGTRQVGPFPYPVIRVPAMPLPGYPSFRLGLPSRRVRAALAGHGTEIVHLASPVFLGAFGASAASTRDCTISLCSAASRPTSSASSCQPRWRRGPTWPASWSA